MALVETRDFESRTSGRRSKMIHDGLCYLALAADLPRFARYDATFEPRIGHDQANTDFASWRAAILP